MILRGEELRSRPKVAVVIVTFNSGQFLAKCLNHLESQTRRPERVVIVDAGSGDKAYLQRIEASPLPCTLILESNIGYCAANNAGWSVVKDADYLLYLNPDAFLTPKFIEHAVLFMENSDSASVGLLGGSLLRYDIGADMPTGFVDSTGIFQKWYGRLFDRDQQQPESALQKYASPAPVPAVCAAAVFCRISALSAAAEDGHVFDPSYFMYKDDIDLSWRVRRAGWRLMYHPGLVAYHCRGWRSRKVISREMRLLSARNEIRLYSKFHSPRLLYSLLKYAFVWSFGI
jgi:GT2 family glycosyltransferase